MPFTGRRPLAGSSDVSRAFFACGGGGNFSALALPRWLGTAVEALASSFLALVGCAKSGAGSPDSDGGHESPRKVFSADPGRFFEGLAASGLLDEGAEGEEVAKKPSKASKSSRVSRLPRACNADPNGTSSGMFGRPGNPSAANAAPKGWSAHTSPRWSAPRSTVSTGGVLVGGGGSGGPAPKAPGGRPGGGGGGGGGKNEPGGVGNTPEPN
mmetsp:Transcript_105388/g.302982  ORF Transcript_105388/g.302982 Transcript_105388/m.302982 type:complete len:212 (+) Transcript_105388:366-1001(+)